jgi:hypothetical protein
MKGLVGLLGRTGIDVCDIASEAVSQGNLLHEVFPLGKSNGAECAAQENFRVAAERLFGFSLQETTIAEFCFHTKRLQCGKRRIGRRSQELGGFIVRNDEGVLSAEL